MSELTTLDLPASTVPVLTVRHDSQTAAVEMVRKLDDLGFTVELMTVFSLSDFGKRHRDYRVRAWWPAPPVPIDELRAACAHEETQRGGDGSYRLCTTCAQKVTP